MALGDYAQIRARPTGGYQLGGRAYAVLVAHPHPVPALAGCGQKLPPRGAAAGSRAAVTILDPFCGTGTVLQEALLRGCDVVGSDLSQKMVDYTTENLAWLQSTFTAPSRPVGRVIDIHQADATTHHWPNSENLTAVVCETYLGQPFSAPPASQKLAEVAGNCNHIITGFLANIRPQLAPNTPLCIAVPAWYDASGHATHLPLIKNLQQLGYYQLNRTPLIYRRPDQIVARELLVLKPIDKTAPQA